MKRFAAALAGLIAIGVTVVFVNRGVVVTVRNVGTEPLSSVVVHVTGNSYPLGDIQAGGDRSVRVFSTGESHIEIQHAEGRLLVNNYFEGGYRGKVSVELTGNEIKRVKDDVRSGII